MSYKRGWLRSSLKFSIIDGMFAAMMVGVSEAYLIPYGIALGATASQVAFLASIPMLVATFFQTYSARITQSIGSRLKLINTFVFLHALGWLPMILIPYFMKGRADYWMPWALLFTATIYTSCGVFATAAWQSLMSDYIPVGKRGRYFGWRNKLQGFFTVTVAIASGLLLHYFGKGNLAGFTLIFTFAMVCRLISWFCLTRMKEPYRKSTHDIYFSFFDFIRQIRTSNFAKFVLFVSLMNLTANISAPLFSVFLLQDLGFSYASYMIIVTTASVSAFFFQDIWGAEADKRGNIAVIKVAGWGVALLPVLWLFSHKLAYLFFVQLIAGASWGGFTLLFNNFLMEAVTPEKRIRCISYFNVVNSAAIFLGACLGGLLMHRLPPIFGYSFLTLFLLSCVGRVVVMIWLSGKVRDVRTLQKPRSV